MTAQKSRLSEVADIIMGQSPPGESYNADGVGLPFFQGKAEFGEVSPVTVKWCSSPSRIAQPEDILLSVRAPVGPTNIAHEICCIGRGLAAIRPNRQYLNNRYLFYFFKRFEADIAQKGVGSTFGAINRKDIERIEIRLPSIEEQNRIVHILDQADELRRLRREANARMRAVVPALFVEMFGDPATNPMEWPEYKISSLCNKSETRNPSSKPEVYFEYIDISSIDNEVGEIIQIKRISGKDAPSRARQVVKTKDIIVSTVRPNLRGSAIIPLELDNQICSTGFCVLRPKTEILGEFLHSLVRTDWFVSLLISKVRGASYPAVSDRDVFEISIPTPSVRLQSEFVMKKNEILGIEKAQKKQEEKMESLFQSILHQAFVE